MAQSLQREAYLERRIRKCVKFPYEKRLSNGCYWVVSNDCARSWTIKVSIPDRCKRFSSPKYPDRVWCPHSLLFHGYPRSFPRVQQLMCEVDQSPQSSVQIMTAAVAPLPLQAFMVWTVSIFLFSSTCLRKYIFDYNRHLLKSCT